MLACVTREPTARTLDGGQTAASIATLIGDFLKGAEPVKYLWPVCERATLDADVYSAGWGAQLERAARATRDAAAAVAKSVRSLISE